jgi:hypothetical protein
MEKLEKEHIKEKALIDETAKALIQEIEDIKERWKKTSED